MLAVEVLNDSHTDEAQRDLAVEILRRARDFAEKYRAPYMESAYD